MEDAGRGANGANLKHRTLYAEAEAAAHKLETERKQAEAEKRARAEAKRAAKQAKEAARKTAEEVKRTTAEGRQLAQTLTRIADPETARMNSKVDLILFEMDFTKRVEEGLASLPRVPRCCCCPERVKLTETEDGKLFCPICAYGVLRTGYCTFHATDHYPELNGTVPHLHLSEYPRELLGVDPSRFKETETEAIVDP